MCNLQGFSRSSSVGLLHDDHIRVSTDPLNTNEVAAEPSSACLWAMVNDFLEMECITTPKNHDTISRAGSLIPSTNATAVSSTASTVLDRAIQELGSIVGHSSSLGAEAKIVHCVIAAVNAEVSAVGEVCANTELVLPSVLQRLQGEGYNAALCVTERKVGSGNSLPPTGGHRYVDVITGELSNSKSLHGAKSSSDQRLIVDVGFPAHFEIARPLPAYQRLIAMLPSTFIGKAELLQRVVRIMCQAARASLESQDMPIPPWRSFSFLYAKWFSSSCTRISSVEEASDVVLDGSTPSASRRGKVRVLVERHCGSEPANMHPASDWAACSGASKRFPSQGDGVKPQLLWHTSPLNDREAEIINVDESTCSKQKTRAPQANVISALALALAEASCTQMLPQCVASAVKPLSRAQSSTGAGAAAVSVL